MVSNNRQESSWLQKTGAPCYLTCLRQSGYAQAGAWPYEALERGFVQATGEEKGKLWGWARINY